MDIRIKKLISKLEEDGWKLIGEIEDSLEWWADSILEFSSDKRPLDAQIYLTVLVDPQWGTTEIDYRKRQNRKSGQGIWAIGISANIPDERLYDFDFLYSLIELGKKRLGNIVDQINELRKTPHNNG